jgi:hypothetical protein
VANQHLYIWLNKDPIEERGGINLYEYIGNDGINIIDIYGYFGDGQTVMIGTGYWILHSPRSGLPDTFHYYTAAEIQAVPLGHSDFDNPYGDFDFTGEDHSFGDSPYNPSGINYHFQTLETSFRQVSKAINDCDIGAYNKSMHRLQDWWTHARNGYTGHWWGFNPISIILSISGVHGTGAGHAGSIFPWNRNPDDDNTAWGYAEMYTEYLNTLWYSNCKKDGKGGWGRKAPCKK